ncbi:MAG TPA: SNF2-related protein [Terriglobia bacterium]|nr:SNF2-related protein [Terriglobia bacterium]
MKLNSPNAAAAPVRWTDKLKAAFDKRSVTRGQDYFLRGLVKVRRGSNTRVAAYVVGNDLYDVSLRLDENAAVLEAGCDCPHASDRFACKHVWATLLAAEDQGYLSPIARMQACSLELSTEDGTTLYDYRYDFLDPSSHRDAGTFPQKPKTPHWKTRLSEIRSKVHRPPVADEPRSVIYVLDAEASALSGEVMLRALIRRRKKDGEWGKPAFHEFVIRSIDDLDLADQRILISLGGIPTTSPSSIPNTYRLPEAIRAVIVPQLCATGRCFLQRSSDRADLAELRWDDGPPWGFHVLIERDESAKAYIVSGVLRRVGEERRLNTAPIIGTGLVVFPDCAARFDDGGALTWVRLIQSMERSGEDLQVPFNAVKDLLSEMAKFPALPPMECPEELRIMPRALAGPPRIRIRQPEAQMYGYAKTANLACDITFDYGVLVPQSSPDGACLDPASGHFFSRDRAAEAAVLARLQTVGVRPADKWDRDQWELPTESLPRMARELVAEGWRVETEGSLYRNAGKFSISVKSGIDWFDLEGAADFDGHSAGIPEILKAISRGETIVRLDDGSLGLLPEEWLDRYRLLAAFGDGGKDGFRFRKHQAGLLDALLASEPEVSVDAGFQRIREELARFNGARPADPGADFRGQLREYQREGLGWLQSLRQFGLGGCLADDMGLGKTVQTLALIDSVERRGPVLVVVPRSLIFNWKQEAAKFAPRLRVLDHTGIGRRERADQIGNYDVILTTYGTLRRDAAVLKEIPFDTVILDEAQAIKNPSTGAAKATRLLKADQRLALTGTPVENRLSDLWSIFEFLNPGMLGSAAVFKEAAGPKENADSASLAVLAQAMRPFILRRAKQQVARELPPKVEQTIYCELDADERRIYNEIRDHYRMALLGRIDAMGIRKSRMHILEALLRLRQAACHTGLLDKSRAGLGSAKIDTLVEQVTEVLAEGHKALVFSQFTSLLGIVRHKLDAARITYEYLDGKTRDRESRVRRFQEDESCKLFLISLKAGGLGLNLTAAEYVFLLDPWWNPAVEAQAIDRSHRIGQARQVFAYRLIARDTVEEKVLALQNTKRELADAIITADNSLIAGLSRENLELLLS